MAIEAIEKEQAELKGQFDQFDKRVERMQTDVDNTKSELTQAINRLSDKMDAGFRGLRDELKQEIQSAKQEFGNTRNWQISCVIAAVIAICAVAGLLIK